MTRTIAWSGMRVLAPVLALSLALCANFSAAFGDAALTPADAIRRADTAFTSYGTYSLTVRSVGGDKGVVYLNSEANYQDPKNLSLEISVPAASELKKTHGDDLAAFFVGKTVWASGDVRRVPIQFVVNGQPTGKGYDQHRIFLTRASDIHLGDPDTLAAQPAAPAPVLAQAQTPAPWPPECKLSLAATLPIAPGRLDIVVPVQVNGAPAQFKLSTSSLVSSISAATVASLGLKTFGLHNKEVRDVGGHDANAYAPVDSLTIGHLKADDLRLLVTTDTPRVDGAIGPELLRRYDLEIDAQAGTVNMFAPHRCEDRAVYWTTSYQTIPADITREGYVRIGVRLDGKLLHATLATGNANSVVSQFAIDSMGLVPVAPARFLHGVEGGTVETAPVSFHSLQIGDITIDSPTLLAADDSRRERRDSTEMSLGMDILRRYHIYIAYEQRKVYLSPAAAH